MATWQYLIKLLPKQGLVDHFSKIPSKIEQVDLENMNIWKHEEALSSFKKALDKIMPFEKSWSNEIEQFGSLEETCIEIEYDSQKISEVCVRLDLTSFKKDVIEFLLSCEHNFDLVVLFQHN